MDYRSGGLIVINSKYCKKKALRFMTNSTYYYIAHTAPLFIQHTVLRVTDICDTIIKVLLYM